MDLSSRELGGATSRLTAAVLSGLTGSCLWPTMLALAGMEPAIAAYDEAQYLLPMYVYPFRATQKDDMGPFRQYIPTWLTPQDPAAGLNFGDRPPPVRMTRA